MDSFFSMSGWAVEGCRLAADQGLSEAQYNLGWAHASGGGVPQDYVEEVKWFRLAADQGDSQAHKCLLVLEVLTDSL